MAPLVVDGSTTELPCVICSDPTATMRLAARRAGSMRFRQSLPPIARAASEGQIEAPADRVDSRSSIVRSNCRSVSLTPCRLQASEQYFTFAQSRAQDARQVMRRPHDAQVRSTGADSSRSDARCRWAIVSFCTERLRTKRKFRIFSVLGNARTWRA